MTQNDHIGIEGLDILRGIAERFALGRAGGGGVEGDDICAQKFGRHLEGHAGAGAGLEEKINDRLATQRGDFLDLAVEDAAEGAGRDQQLFDLSAAELFDGQEMFTMPGHGRRDLIFSSQV